MLKGTERKREGIALSFKSFDSIEGLDSPPREILFFISCIESHGTVATSFKVF